MFAASRQKGSDTPTQGIVQRTSQSSRTHEAERETLPKVFDAYPCVERCRHSTSTSYAIWTISSLSWKERTHRPWTTCLVSLSELFIRSVCCHPALSVRIRSLSKTILSHCWRRSYMPSPLLFADVDLALSCTSYHSSIFFVQSILSFFGSGHVVYDIRLALRIRVKLLKLSPSVSKPIWVNRA